MATLTDAQTEKPPRQLSNFTVRYLTALVFIPFGIAGMYIGGALWVLMMAPLAVIGGLEFYSLATGRPNEGIAQIGILASLIVLAGFYAEFVPIIVAGLVIALLGGYGVSVSRKGDAQHPLSQAWTTLVGVLYIGIPVGMLIAISNLEQGFLWLVVIFGITWGTDTLAYAGGRMWGKRKLAPKLSPKKTVEGAMVGVIGGILPPLLFLLRADAVTVAAVLMIIGGPFVAIAGDLLESAIKRYYEVKDSHLARLNVIPGHGGVLDRIDALLVVTVYCFFFITLSGIGG